MKLLLYTFVYVTFVLFLIYKEFFQSLNEVYIFSLIIVFTINIVFKLSFNLIKMKKADCTKCKHSLIRETKDGIIEITCTYKGINTYTYEEYQVKKCNRFEEEKTDKKE